MPPNNTPQMQIGERLRLTVLLVAPLLVYVFSVLGNAWSLKASGHFSSVMNTVGFHECEKKYHAKENPGSDMNLWLFENYEEITFHSIILSDSECMGKLIALGNQYILSNPERHQIVIRLMESATMDIRSKITIKP